MATFLYKNLKTGLVHYSETKNSGSRRFGIKIATVLIIQCFNSKIKNFRDSSEMEKSFVREPVLTNAFMGVALKDQSLNASVTSDGQASFVYF